MGRDQALGPLMRQGVRHARPPIASLRHPALVAKALHQRRPGAGDPVHVPARLDRLSEKAKPGSDGTTDMERVFRPPPQSWVGSLSGPMISTNSTNDPGHPCVRMIGSAFR